jgi:eukaryotic-like serine/threonine-protein kinase
MGSPQDKAPPPGTVIAGKYRVDRVLASGGMGVIVEAEHAALGQRVAIKFLLPEAGSQGELVERFLREARSAARLQSDHVVRVFDIGTDERGAPFMVMELLSGRDLGDEIEARGALPVPEAVGYLVEALDAIVEAHAAGIVHRDLKPGNLFLVTRADGVRRIKVLDFGISKLSSSTIPDAELTSTKSMLGSPGYMSPEQVRSTKSVDARTDVWALGVILYEMLTGAPAFQGETLGDIFAKIREEDLPPIRERRADVPEGLAAVLAQCLQRNREKRVADAITLRRSLLPFCAGPAEISHPPTTSPTLTEDTSPPHGVELASAATLAAPSMGDADAPTPPPGTETLASWSGEHRGNRRSRILAGGALAVSAAIGLTAWMALRSPGSPPGPLTSPPAGGSAVLGANGAPGAGPSSGASASPVVTPVEPAPPPVESASALPAASASAPPSRSTKVEPRAHPSAVPSAVPTTATTTTKKKKEDLGI